MFNTYVCKRIVDKCHNLINVNRQEKIDILTLKKGPRFQRIHLCFRVQIANWCCSTKPLWKPGFCSLYNMAQGNLDVKF